MPDRFPPGLAELLFDLSYRGEDVPRDAVETLLDAPGGERDRDGYLVLLTALRVACRAT